MSEWKVTAGDSGLKLPAFIKQKLGSAVTLRQLKQAIEHNACHVNGRVERFASFSVGTGDVVDFRMEGLEGSKSSFKLDPSGIIFSDGALLICNKPAGISSDSLELLKFLKGSGSFLELIHRLDSDTTGLLIFAKSPKAASYMKLLFKERKIRKEYWAIAEGVPKAPKGTVDNFLGKIHEYQGQALWGEVKSEGLRAITEWQRLKVGNAASLILCRPLTGRTHQLRVHLSALGYPILGDRQYARQSACRYHASRCLLHARGLKFPHPLTGEMIELEAPLPIDFKEAMKALGLE